jgi:5-methylcytosine-specific restriction enzyme A
MPACRYDHRRWRARSRRQLQREPLCVMCATKGIVTAAEVADHITRHKGDEYQFFCGELQSLCQSCHSKTKQQIETRGYSSEIGENGQPTDRNHPWYGRQ